MGSDAMLVGIFIGGFRLVVVMVSDFFYNLNISGTVCVEMIKVETIFKAV